MDFLAYIGENYDLIKSLLKQYKDFDEDIMHNTIIKCDEVVKENELVFRNENEMLRYFIGAYKTNILREKLYYYNKNSDHNVELSSYDKSDDSHDTESLVELRLICDNIECIFGTELKNVYIKYISEDISILKLQEETGIKNLKLRIRDIKDYIMANYKKEDLY